MSAAAGGLFELKRIPMQPPLPTTALPTTGKPIEFVYYQRLLTIDLKSTPIEIYDPSETIKALNRANKNITPAERAACEFSAEAKNSTIPIGIAQRLGNRPYQQDCTAAGTLSDTFQLLPENYKNHLIKSIPSLIQEHLIKKNVAKNSGAAFLMLAIDKSGIRAVNAGDCVAIAMYIHKNTGEVSSIMQINREHRVALLPGLSDPKKWGKFKEEEKKPFDVIDPVDPEQKRTLTIQAVSSRNGRMGAYRLHRYNMYQSLGDDSPEAIHRGLRHDGEYYPPEHLNTIKPLESKLADYRLRIILGSDSMKENLCELNNYKTICERNREKSCTQLAECIGDEVILRGGTDNTSVMVIDIDNLNVIKPHYVAMIDGHGIDNSAAEQIKMDLHRLVETELEKTFFLQYVNNLDTCLDSAYPQNSEEKIPESKTALQTHPADHKQTVLSTKINNAVQEIKAAASLLKQYHDNPVLAKNNIQNLYKTALHQWYVLPLECPLKDTIEEIILSDKIFRLVMTENVLQFIANQSQSNTAKKYTQTIKQVLAADIDHDARLEQYEMLLLRIYQDYDHWCNFDRGLPTLKQSLLDIFYHRLQDPEELALYADERIADNDTQKNYGIRRQP